MTSESPRSATTDTTSAGPESTLSGDFDVDTTIIKSPGHETTTPMPLAMTINQVPRQEPMAQPDCKGPELDDSTSQESHETFAHATKSFKETVTKHVKDGNSDLVEECVFAMLGKGSDLEAFNTVINAHAKIGNITGAEQWLRRMVSNSVEPNVATFGMLCKAYAYHGETRKIQDLMDRMEAGGGELNEYFYAALVSACSRVQPPEMARAERAVWELAQRGLRVRSVRGLLVRTMVPQEAEKLLAKVEAASGQTRYRKRNSAKSR